MNHVRDLGRIIAAARGQLDPTPAETAMINEAVRIGSSPEGLGYALGIALVRAYGSAGAYVVSDAVQRGIQIAMREAK